MGEILLMQTRGNVEWSIYCVAVLSILILIFESGYRIGVRKQPEINSGQRSQVGTVLGATLAQFGFLLAFSFGIAESRFRERKAIVLKEGNSISTTFLRSDFLPEPQRSKTRHLIREYAKIRLDAVHQHEVTTAIQESETIQTTIWSITKKISNELPNSLPVALFVESLNEMIDLHEERITVALSYRLPPSLIWVLYLVCFFATIALGFSTGLSGKRNLFVTLPLILSFGAVLLLIVDLDQIHPHFFTITQNPMVDVLHSIDMALKKN